MARIVYKKGFENQNKLECIEGIEIEMLNGQCALIYPKYAELPFLSYNQIDKWKEDDLMEVEALKEEDNIRVTNELLMLNSPAAKFVSQFKSDVYGHFNLPTLIAAVEITCQREGINAIAKTIESADLLKEDAKVSSCSRCYRHSRWAVNGLNSIILYYGLSYPYTCVPTIVYRKKKMNMKQFSMKFFNIFTQCKEYLFVKRYSKNSFEVGKIGYYNHYKNSQENKNYHMFFFGTLFDKWFCESIQLCLKDGKRYPHLAIVTPKHVFWWYFKTSKDKNAFEHKRFQITTNDHASCG